MVQMCNIYYLQLWSTMNLKQVDDGGRWHTVDSTYNGNAWSRLTNKHFFYLWNILDSIPVVNVNYGIRIATRNTVNPLTHTG